ncbi:MAG: helix-turn-helix domain-containing protein [Candidatus Levyibacteriota bacterium]
MIRLGDRLREEREKKNLTILQVAKATKIRPHFIEALEKGEYKKLPSSAYAQGFVKNYIEFLELPAKELLPLFRREFNEKEYLGVLPESFTRGAVKIRKVRLWQTTAIILGVLFLFATYIFLQYRAAIFSPSLSIENPKENAVITTIQVNVSGQTDINTTVTVNNLPTFVDTTGHFQKDLTLFSGKQTIIVKAVNNFGKTATVERHITLKSP